MTDEMKTKVNLTLTGEELTDAAAVLSAYVETCAIQDADFNASLIRTINKMKHTFQQNTLTEVK